MGEWIGAPDADPQVRAYAKEIRPANRRRRGKAKARKAVGHSLLVAIWHMLTTGELYSELGHDWFEKRNSPERRARRHLAELAALGWQLTSTPEGNFLAPPRAA